MQNYFCFRGNNFTDTAIDMYNNHSCPVFSRFRAIKRNDEKRNTKIFSIFSKSSPPPQDWRFLALFLFKSQAINNFPKMVNIDMHVYIAMEMYHNPFVKIRELNNVGVI